MNLSRKDFSFLGAILLSLVVFYPELFLAKAGSLVADHIEQHYPWGFMLYDALKSMSLPFWTPHVQAGFPLIAEGQVGAFYLINLILYAALPFQWAYSYLNIIHFALSGWATYLYARQMKMDPIPAFIAGFIFLFGTSYGGAYYNITSLKTICWFPMALFAFERFYETEKRRFLFLLSFVVSLMLLAGYLQVAIFTFGTLLFYGFVRIFFIADDTNKTWPKRLYHGFSYLLALGLAMVVASPQILLTFDLAVVSNRSGLTEDYAYVGSMSPFAVLTLVFSNMQGIFRGNSLYMGLFTLFLVLCSFHSFETRRSKNFKLWVAMILFAFFFAIGRWSPIYVGLVKLTQFYSFRTPTKFLIFICFSLSIFAGLGWQAISRSFETKAPPFHVKAVVKQFAGLLGVFTGAALVLFYFLNFQRELLTRWGRTAVEQLVYGKAGHPHSLEDYYVKLESYLDTMKSVFMPHDFGNLLAISSLLLAVAFALWIWKKGEITKNVLIVGFIFLFVDLYGVACRDMKYDFAKYEKSLETNPIIEKVLEAKEKGGLGRIHGVRSIGQDLPLVPSKNMLYDVEDIGFYSPLAMQRYHESIGLLGNVNDSTIAYEVSPEYLLARLPLLNHLDVSHILSTKELNHSELSLIEEYEGVKLYHNRSNHRRGFFVSQLAVFDDWKSLRERLMSPGFNPSQVLLLEKEEFEKISSHAKGGLLEPQVQVERVSYSNTRETWQVITNQPGFFVITNSIFPGWSVTVDGQKAPLLAAYGLFQAIWIDEPGHHQIELVYKPSFIKFNEMM